MKKRIALILAFALLLALSACSLPPLVARTEPTEDTTEAPVDFDPIESSEEYLQTLTYMDPRTNEDVDYLFHEPVRDTGKQYPLIIFLHGLGNEVTESQLSVARYLVDSLIYLENSSDDYSAYTLIPVTPHGNEGWWTDSQIEAFKKLMYEIIDQYNVDTKRIYISGISMGGMTTCRLLNEMPADTFAAAVPLSGVRMMTDPNKVRNTAIRIYHTTADNVVSVSSARNLYQQLKNAGHPDAKLTEFNYGDHVTPVRIVFYEQYDTFFPWLFAQRLP